MKARIDPIRANPGVIQAMLGLEKQVRQAGFDHGLLDLVRMRASQINGCSYCLDMHLNVNDKDVVVSVSCG